MFVHELALQLRMPVGELGNRMSNYELNVLWPAYFAASREEASIRQKLEGAVSAQEFDTEHERTNRQTLGGGAP